MATCYLKILLIVIITRSIEVNSQCRDILNSQFCVRIARTNGCTQTSNFYVANCCETCSRARSSIPRATMAMSSPIASTTCRGDTLPSSFCQRMTNVPSTCQDASSYYSSSCCQTCLRLGYSIPNGTTAHTPLVPPRPAIPANAFAQPQPAPKPAASRPSQTIPPPISDPAFEPQSDFVKNCGKRLQDETFFTENSPPIDSIRESYDNKVFGGRVAKKNTWPWMALVGNHENGKLNWFCGGSLINEEWVLTAAHCLLEGIEIVRLGEHEIGKSDPDFPPEDYLVDVSLWYPGYQSSQKYHDLALLHLSFSGSMNPRFRPICLPWHIPEPSLIGSDVIVTGWGATAYLGARSEALREATIHVFHTIRCTTAYSQLRSQFKRSWPQGMSPETVLCAGHPTGDTDACQGDSGGPLVKGDHEKYIQYGIVSAGFGCGSREFPGIYIPLFQENYLEWIRSVAFK